MHNGKLGEQYKTMWTVECTKENTGACAGPREPTPGRPPTSQVQEKGIVFWCQLDKNSDSCEASWVLLGLNCTLTSPVSKYTCNKS